jgi:hypothetical protein
MCVGYNTITNLFQMKHKIIFSILLLASFTASAQMEINKMERLLLDKKDSIGIPSSKWMVNLSGDYLVNSNSLTNQFISRFGYAGKFIDGSMKDHESGRLKSNNRLGMDANVGIHAAYSGEKWNYLFGVGHREFIGARYSSDFFELLLRGNSSYAGRTAELDKVNIENFNYQSFYIGAQRKLNDGKLIVGASLAALRGGKYLSMEMADGRLYTEPFGQYVEYTGALSLMRYPKDSSASALTSRGAGAALNLYLSAAHGKNRLNVEVRDIGFITWKNIQHYSAEQGTYHYNGILIDDILGPGSSALSNITIDSIATAMNINIQKKNHTMLLPGVIHINYVMMPNRRFSRTIGLKYMATYGYIPQVYIRGADYLGKGFTLVNTFSYGGFGRLDYELGVLKKINNGFIVSANLFAFEFLVLPGKSSGHGLNIGLTKLF